MTIQPSPTSPPIPVRALLDPIAPEAFGPDQARHLLRRAGFGGTEIQVNTLVSWGLDEAVNHLVDYENVPSEPDTIDLFNKDLIRPASRAEQDMLRTARQRGDEDTVARFRNQRQAAQRSDRQQMAQIRRWWIQRMIQTPRPLEEKLTLFWHGHFATSFRGVEDSYHMYMQNRMFRGNALSYPRLLAGIIRDPAMLRYLNNNQNRRQSPNENLARELMELFSLGEGNYTERDIKEGARALTGYTYEDDAFVFRENLHDNGPKQVLGTRDRVDGDGFVTAILRHQACAPFIATRLYRFFVADVPAQPRDLKANHRACVTMLADRITRERYDLAPVLKILFKSRHFYSDAIVHNKIKSPAELVVGAVRTLGVPARDLNTMADALERMGQNLFFPPSVKGWDGGRSWINTATLFARQNTLAYLITGAQPNSPARRAISGDYDPRSMMPMLVEPGKPTDTREIVGRLMDLAMGRRHENAIGTLTETIESSDNPTAQPALAALMMLITAMPEYQLC